MCIRDSSLADRYSQMMKENWLAQNGYGYMELAPGADPQTVIDKAAPILNRALTSDLHRLGVKLTGAQAYLLHLSLIHIFALAGGIGVWVLAGSRGSVYRVPLNRLTIATVTEGPFEDYIAVRGAVAPFIIDYLTTDQGRCV